MLDRNAAAIKLPIGGFQVLMDPPPYKWVAVGISGRPFNQTPGLSATLTESDNVRFARPPLKLCLLKRLSASWWTNAENHN
jgi:hypothetical protein